MPKSPDESFCTCGAFEEGDLSIPHARSCYMWRDEGVTPNARVVHRLTRDEEAGLWYEEPKIDPTHIARPVALDALREDVIAAARSWSEGTGASSFAEEQAIDRALDALAAAEAR